MNPFKEKPLLLEKTLCGLKDMYPKASLKEEINPYTKARTILMNGAEFEANWYSHNFNRHTDNYELRQELALMRFGEKQQQQELNMLKPINESILETTIGYEQLAVDLTAFLAKCEKDKTVKNALDFALLEDFDHLYRYANLLESDDGIRAEKLVGGYTEIMPARPTMAHHRHPLDNPKRNIDGKKADKQTVLNTLIITAAEQQTMNYYMNVSGFYKNDAGRKLFEEICLIEEEHVTQYGSLIDSNASYLEGLLWREYNECYLYWSCCMTEIDKTVKKIWEANFEIEVSHLHKAVELLKKYEKKDYAEVITDGEFPAPIELKENIDYVRMIINNTAQYTGKNDGYEDIGKLAENDRFFSYSKMFNSPLTAVASHMAIENNIAIYKEDYRYETAINPLKPLQDRTKDNVTVGVKPLKINSVGFKTN